MTVERTAGAGRRTWPVPAGLVVLSVVPVVAGVLRLVQLAGGPALMPADDRFDVFPVAIVVHIAGSAAYALAGAFQFLPRFRRRHPAWHRRTGRVLVAAGLAVAGSALWLTLFYPAKPGTGPLLYALRLIFASSMVAALVLGFAAVRRRDIAGHRAWMIRAYAIGLAAGTQVVTESGVQAVLGAGELTGDLAKGAGWVLNLAFAEWAIRRGVARRTRPRRAPTPQEVLS